VGDAFAGVAVTQTKLAELVPTDAVEEQDGQERAIALAQHRVLGRRLKELAGLSIAQGWGLALVGALVGPLDAIDRVVQDGVALAEVFVETRDGGELARDGG
jgi:hypothetical protein